MRKCEKGTGFTWMLNKSARSSCHSLTCALFVCGYCLSLGVAGGERCQFAHCWQPARSARPPWDMRQNKPHTQTQPFTNQVYQPPTHTQTPAQPMSFWSLNLLSVSQSLMHKTGMWYTHETVSNRMNHNEWVQKKNHKHNISDELLMYDIKMYDIKNKLFWNGSFLVV